MNWMSRVVSGRVKEMDARKSMPEVWGPMKRWEVAAVIVVTAAFLVLGLVFIAKGAPLGHDESVYGLRSRFYSHGDVKGGYWNDYRAVGLPLLMTPMWLVSGTEPYLRSAVLVFGALGIVLTWAWTRLMFGRVAGVLAASVLAVIPAYLRWSFQIIPDVPGMILSLAAVFVFALAARGDRLSNIAVAVVPLVGIATAVRYGSPMVLAVGLGAVGVANWPKVRARIGFTGAVAGACLVIVSGILLMPPVTGSEMAPLQAVRARQVAKDAPWWGSVGDFIDVLPTALGPVGGLVCAVGLLLCGVGVWKGWLATREVVLNLGVAAIFILLLNLSLGHGESRYLLPAFPFALACIGAGLAVGSRYLNPRVAIGLGIVLFVSAGSISYVSGAEAIESLNRFSPLREASRHIETAYGADCAVLTSYSPQVSWYSGCAARALPYRSPEDVDQFWGRLSETLDDGFEGVGSDGQVATVLVNQGKRQPEGVTREAFESLFAKVIVEIGGPEGRRLEHVRALHLGRLGALRERIEENASEEGWEAG